MSRHTTAKDAVQTYDPQCGDGEGKGIWVTGSGGIPQALEFNEPMPNHEGVISNTEELLLGIIRGCAAHYTTIYLAQWDAVLTKAGLPFCDDLFPGHAAVFQKEANAYMADVKLAMRMLFARGKVWVHAPGGKDCVPRLFDYPNRYCTVECFLPNPGGRPWEPRAAWLDRIRLEHAIVENQRRNRSELMQRINAYRKEHPSYHEGAPCLY